jgi:oxygen-independent coproporphyrinogen-3 oxidase
MLENSNLNCRPVGLYIHTPFCRMRCAYCDFNVYAGMRDLYTPYAQAVAAEIERAGLALGRLPAPTLYFGGGTPSLLPVPLLAQITAACRAAFAVPADAEISLEANPDTLDAATLAGLRALGVNRLSLGVQSAQPDELRFLRRDHTWADAARAFQLARQAGFDNINLDLIYGLPNQPLAAWQDTVEKILALAPDHLSMYSLTIEDRTTLSLWIRRGQVSPPDDDLAADMALWADERVTQAGYVRYEISNWARNQGLGTRGKDLETRFVCQHNLTYWHNLPYLGFGAGAHSSFGGRRFWNVAHPRRYAELVMQGQSPQAGQESIDREMEMAETMFLGLRLAEGINGARFLARFGVDLFQQYKHAIERNKQAGLLEGDTHGIRLTRRGWLLGNRVFADFLPETD